MGHLLPAGALLYVQYTTICVEFQVLSSGGVRRNWFSLSAVEQMKEQGIDAGDFSAVSIKRLAGCFKEYVESTEDIAAVLSGVINKMGVNIGIDEKYRLVSEVYDEICEYKLQKEECQKR